MRKLDEPFRDKEIFDKFSFFNSSDSGFEFLVDIDPDPWIRIFFWIRILSTAFIRRVFNTFLFSSDEIEAPSSGDGRGRGRGVDRSDSNGGRTPGLGRGRGWGIGGGSKHV